MDHSDGSSWQSTAFMGKNAEVRQGDKVFHYVNGYMVAVSSATADCIESENPIEQHNNNI